MLSSQTLCYLTRSGTKLSIAHLKVVSTCSAVPHPLVCSAAPGKLHPPIQLITTLSQGLIFPVSALPAQQSFLSPWPPALPAAIAVCGAFVLSPGLVVPSSLFALWEAQMSVGTVLFQSSSYGKEGRLLCCLGEGTTEPSAHFTGRMLGDIILSCPLSSGFPSASRRMRFFQVCLCLVV